MRTLVFLTMLLVAPQVHATTARFIPLAELVQRSETVVLGRSVDETSFWQGPRILTLVKVQVAEVWAGQGASPGQTVEVLTAGGVVGNIGQRVDGAAVMPVGQQLVLHLNREFTGEYSTLGMAQGVWYVRETPPGALSVSRPNVDRLVGAPSGTVLPNTLADLKQAVIEAAHAP